MAQEATEAPAEGQKPPETEAKEGQEPQGESKEEPKTFDADYVKTLRSENAAARKRAQEAEARIQEFEERDKSETEKLTGKLTKAEQRAVEAEAKLVRYEVAAEKQVPAKLVPLLTASSKEELEAQADLILENAKSDPAPEFDGGARDPAPEPKTPQEGHNDFLLNVLGVSPQNTT